MKKIDVGDTYDQRVVYRKEDLPWIRDRIQEGQKFRVENKEEYMGVREICYTILEKFTYHASCVDRHGLRRSFNYFELYEMLSGVA